MALQFNKQVCVYVDKTRRYLKSFQGIIDYQQRNVLDFREKGYIIGRT